MYIEPWLGRSHDGVRPVFHEAGRHWVYYVYIPGTCIIINNIPRRSPVMCRPLSAVVPCFLQPAPGRDLDLCSEAPTTGHLLIINQFHCIDLHLCHFFVVSEFISLPNSNKHRKSQVSGRNNGFTGRK